MKSETAKKYRTKHPEMPTLKLARIMYDENKLLFTDVENARTTLRYIEGKQGVRNKSKIKGSVYALDEPRPYNPYNLPKSDETEYLPFILEARKILLLSDIHIPYHSIQAVSTALDYGVKENPDCILLNGDILDFHGLSKFAKDPSKRKFSDELDAFKELFSVIKKTFPKARVIYKLGNHEERYFHFLWQKAAELAGVEEFELESIIAARAPGVEVVKDKRIIKAGGLNVIHGHEFATGFFSPVNVARGLYLRGKTSAIQAHSHQSSEHTETDMNGNIMTTWSVGALCELHPQYMPINKWNHGFAVIDVDGENFEVTNKRIYKGKIL